MPPRRVSIPLAAVVNRGFRAQSFSEMAGIAIRSPGPQGRPQLADLVAPGATGPTTSHRASSCLSAYQAKLSEFVAGRRLGL